mmetsp:Transcript_22760/g.46957  ORF Transcript_22760/g.46957 Transcript_22760/m.46957 type:complete len:675 (-) Transcript_22760:64-2088(-)
MNPPPSSKPSPLLRLMILTTMSLFSTVAATTALRDAGGKALLRSMHSNGKPTLAWSFLPRSAPSNRSFAMMPRRSTAVRAIGSRSTLNMWGEEDVPRQKSQIPSNSPFSTSSDWGNGDDQVRQRRPPRRSPPAPTSGWGDNNDDFGDDGFNNRRPSKRNNDSGSSGNRGGSRSSSSSGWDDFDDGEFGDFKDSYEPYVYSRPSGGRGNKPPNNNGQRGGGRRDNYGRGGGRGGGRSRDADFGGGRGRGGRGRGDKPGRGGRTTDDPAKQSAVKINLKLIENAGYQHLYGIAPVLNALKANVRDFSNPQVEDEDEDLLDFKQRLSSLDEMDDDDNFGSFDSNVEEDKPKRDIKPEAKLSPSLFVQEGTLDNIHKRTFRSSSKKEASGEIIALAEELSLPIVETDKGVLNTLCGNRPHQGFVLRCGGLDFSPVKGIPAPGKGDGPALWLALDEVVDPQNLGALLRSAYFLGGGPGLIRGDDDSDNDGTARKSGGVGIIVCAKNSSPLSPTVSAASAGALEDMAIYSTSNLPKLLYGAEENGWRVLGAAAEVPNAERDDSKRRGENNVNTSSSWDAYDDEEVNNEVEDEPGISQQQCFDLDKVETGVPTVLVLGSEGRGLRTLVARACSGFVRIPGGAGSFGGAEAENLNSDSQAGVDSLNVSVTGGILLWHFFSNR